MMRSIMKKEKQPKKALGIVYSQSTDNLFEELWMRIRMEFRPYKISKSQIIEQLIILAYVESEKDPKNKLHAQLTKLIKKGAI